MADIRQDLLPDTLSIAPADKLTGVFSGATENTTVSKLLGGFINSQPGVNYSLVLTDAGAVVEMTNASANTLLVPQNSSVAFPIGTQICVVQYGAGRTTIAAGPGVTIRNVGYIPAQYAAVFLQKRAADEWVLYGATVSGGILTLTAPVLSLGTVTSSTIPMTWTDPNSSPNEASFEIQRSNDGSTGWADVSTPAANATSFTDTGLSSGVTRYYRIRAVGDGVTANTSSWSNVINGTTSTSLITLDTPTISGTVTESPAGTWNGTGTPNLVWLKTMAADGTYQVDLPTGTDGVVIGLHSTSGNEAYSGFTWALYYNGSTYNTQESGSNVNTGVSWASGHKMRIKIVGTTVSYEYSSDGGTTWTNLRTSAVTRSAGTLYLKVGWAYTNKCVNPKGTGVA
jgi:hypothetical protein